MATEDEEVNSMSQDDDTGDWTGYKYLPGFADAVKRLQGPKTNTWGPVYSDEAAFEQALRQAYWAGRMDGVDSVLGHPAAPAGVLADEETEVPRLSLEEVWADLGLFEAPAECPGPIGAAVEAWLAEHDLQSLKADDDPYVWVVIETMEHLGLDLAAATEFVAEVVE